MTTRDLYRTMRTSELVLLQQAFRLDLETASRVTTGAFCERRLAWIAEVLRERNASDLDVKQQQLQAQLDAVSERLQALERAREQP